MRKAYDLQLKELHDMVKEMGDMCEEIITLAAKALQVEEDGLYERFSGWTRRLTGRKTRWRRSACGYCCGSSRLLPTFGEFRRR